MSRSQSKPERIERRIVDQTEAKISFYTNFAHPSYEKRVEIEHDSDEWTFGINNNDAASVMSADADDETPEWIVLSFRALGVEVDDS
jgi:hypothetical protein